LGLLSLVLSVGAIAWFTSTRGTVLESPPASMDTVSDLHIAIDGSELSRDVHFPVKKSYKVTGRFAGRTGSLCIARAFVMINGKEVLAQSAVLELTESNDDFAFSGSLGTIPKSMEMQLRIIVDNEIVGSRPFIVR
jgi:hypothetical protein